jgi:NAD-dependent aldehyde dehydrogenases
MPAMKEKFAGVDRYRHFINGQWTDSTPKEWIEVENPATGEIIATVPKGTPTMRTALWWPPRRPSRAGKPCRPSSGARC